MNSAGIVKKFRILPDPRDATVANLERNIRNLERQLREVIAERDTLARMAAIIEGES